ncbi:SPOR domain-containing protein [Thalassococcus sp. S3]|uniref:SPOR domain-containing protein n=1 Tax=Thalassococcus sp. S3 TaxID=2017482 RepID=UPI0010244E17|nr:SPOR domain-containing protein [Thalassococcus sp. S3]QBF31573.1 sporulation protein [Thalassococcus sp. S3]
MADVEFTPSMGGRDAARDEGSAPALTQITRFAGALVSLALVAGAAFWGYKLLVRDVSGVPVVRALEGPMRVQPDNPGGRPADHQGLAVNAVAANGVAAAPADRLVLAPRPVDLTDEDLPRGNLRPVARTEGTPSAAPASNAQETSNTGPNPDAVEAAAQSGSVEALVEELTRGVQPLSQQTAEEAQQSEPTQAAIVLPEPLDQSVLPETEPEGQADPEPAPEVITGPGVGRSLRPQQRPAQRSIPAPTPVAAAAPAGLDVDPESIPAGTRLVQLGAYDSPEVARGEWDKLSARFGDTLTGKSRVIQRASSGGRVFFRLRAMGFDDLSDARRFCSALVAEGSDCIPVVTR